MRPLRVGDQSVTTTHIARVVMEQHWGAVRSEALRRERENDCDRKEPIACHEQVKGSVKLLEQAIGYALTLKVVLVGLKFFGGNLLNCCETWSASC
jgi:hypothetical protein